MMSYRIATIGASIAIIGMIASSSEAGNIIVNGGFESPVVYTAPATSRILEIFAGQDPAGFGWAVNSGSVEVIGQGYVSPSGQNFSGPAYAGQQYLDLDGLSPGTISQTFVTTAGTRYELDFAYGDNAAWANVLYPGPAVATVSVIDQVSGMNLIDPLTISHGTSTFSNYNWTLSGPIEFTALSSSTTLSFASLDPPTSEGGIFLDGISVSAVPEPSSLLLGMVALTCVGVLIMMKAPKNPSRMVDGRGSGDTILNSDACPWIRQASRGQGRSSVFGKQ